MSNSSPAGLPLPQLSPFTQEGRFVYDKNHQVFAEILSEDNDPDWTTRTEQEALTLTTELCQVLNKYLPPPA